MRAETSALEAQVRRLRSGIVALASSTLVPDPSESEFVRVVSAASLAWGNQLERIDRFSLPLQTPVTGHGERASAATTSRLFLEQLISDYRRVASPKIDLQAIERRRRSEHGAAILESAGVVPNRPVAPFAVAERLILHQKFTHSGLEIAMDYWVSAERNTGAGSPYATAFGDVLGSLIEVALGETHTRSSTGLPTWSDHVGEKWCEDFLQAGAAIVRNPALLDSSHPDWNVFVSHRRGSVDVAQVVDEILRIVSDYRPVEDVRVRAAGSRPKIDLILSGDNLRPSEFNEIMRRVDDAPADVMILPNIPD